MGMPLERIRALIAGEETISPDNELVFAPYLVFLLILSSNVEMQNNLAGRK